MKRCPRCGLNKPTSDFYRNRAQPDGLQTYCKPCKDADPAKKASDARYWTTVTAAPEAKARRDAYVKGWQEFHVDRMRAYGRRSVAKFRANNPERARQQAREHAHRRRAAKRQAPREVFSETSVFERDAWTCQLCRLPIDKSLPRTHPMGASIDHIIPLSRGGHHTLVNVQATHLTCNHRKAAKAA